MTVELNKSIAEIPDISQRKDSFKAPAAGRELRTEGMEQRRVATLPPPARLTIPGENQPGMNLPAVSADPCIVLREDITRIFQKDLWGNVTRAKLRGCAGVDAIVKKLIPLCSPRACDRTGTWPTDKASLEELKKDAEWLRDLTRRRLARFSLDRPEWTDMKLVPARMTMVEAGRLLYAAGWRDEKSLGVAIAVMWGESGGECRQITTSGGLERSVGLMQINNKAHPQYPVESLKQPKYNLTVARDMYEWNGWQPWSAWKNGSYRGYLRQAKQAAARIFAEDRMLLALAKAGRSDGAVIARR